jgi:hypothetical protein
MLISSATFTLLLGLQWLLRALQREGEGEIWCVAFSGVRERVWGGNGVQKRLKPLPCALYCRGELGVQWVASNAIGRQGGAFDAALWT